MEAPPLSDQQGIHLLAWLLVPVALVYLISLRSPVFADRYLCWPWEWSGG